MPHRLHLYLQISRILLHPLQTAHTPMNNPADDTSEHVRTKSMSAITSSNFFDAARNSLPDLHSQPYDRGTLDPTFIETIQGSDTDTVIKHPTLSQLQIKKDTASPQMKIPCHINAISPGSLSLESDQNGTGKGHSISPESVNPLLVRQSSENPSKLEQAQPLIAGPAPNRWTVFLGLYLLMVVFFIVLIVLSALTLKASRNKVRDVMHGLNDDERRQVIDLLSTIYWSSRVPVVSGNATYNDILLD